MKKSSSGLKGSAVVDPQVENGFFRIANELGEAFAGIRLAGQESQVVWAVARLTYGYGNKSDEISHSQISKMTNIPRPKVAGLMTSLISKKVLTATNNGSRKPLTIGINKHYDEWTHLLPKKGIPHIGCSTATNNGSKSATNNGTHQRKKEIKRNTIALSPANGTEPSETPFITIPLNRIILYVFTNVL